MLVAPRVGARIEITFAIVRARAQNVAPRVGARIEIAKDNLIPVNIYVAPRVGARIEIRLYAPRCKCVSGRSPCGSED